MKKIFKFVKRKKNITIIFFLNRNCVENNYLQLSIMHNSIYDYNLYTNFSFMRRSCNFNFFRKIFYSYNPMDKGFFSSNSDIYDLSDLSKLNFVEYYFGNNFSNFCMKFEKHSLFKKMKEYLELGTPEKIFLDKDLATIDAFHRYVIDILFYIVLFSDLDIFKDYYELSYNTRIKNKENISLMDTFYLLRYIKEVLYDTLYFNKKTQKQFEYKGYFYLGVSLANTTWEPKTNINKINDMSGII